MADGCRGTRARAIPTAVGGFSFSPIAGQGRASGLFLQLGLHPPLTVDDVCLTGTLCSRCPWNVGSGHLGFLNLVFVHVSGD